MHLDGDDVGDEAFNLFANRFKQLFAAPNTENLRVNLRLLTSRFDQIIKSDDAENLDNSISRFLSICTKEPEWLDWKLVAHGQNVFKRYESSSLLGLLCYSLVGGFTAPRIVQVLFSASNLTKSRDVTYRRLLDTLEMVFNCMSSVESLQPGADNIGWKSVLRTRLIHSCIRVHLMNQSILGSKEFCIPINQEDLVCTLYTFSANILTVMKYFGAPLSEYDEYCYCHAWRYIGYLIGVKDEYNPCISVENLHKTYINIILPNLTFEDQSQLPSGKLARQVLDAASSRPPRYISYLILSELSRSLLGIERAHQLGIEKSLTHRIIVWLLIFCLRFWNYFIASRLNISNPIFHRLRQRHFEYLHLNLKLLKSSQSSEGKTNLKVNFH